MIRNFFKGFGFAFQGIAYAFSTQLNFKVHVVAALFTCVLGYYTELSISEWIWIAAAIFLVLIAELINTAIELLVDLISPQYNIKAGIIKDVSAAAVLLTAVLALVIGLLIFIPKFF